MRSEPRLAPHIKAHGIKTQPRARRRASLTLLSIDGS